MIYADAYTVNLRHTTVKQTAYERDSIKGKK